MDNDAMSTQWKKLSEEQPKEGEPVWLYLSTSTTNRVHYQDNYQPSTSIRNLEGWFWLPAPPPPPPPPDESEAAFNKWWNTEPCNRFNKDTYDICKSAWMSALEWHKNKAKG